MIPCSGTIKASMINDELGKGSTSLFDINAIGERALAGKPSGLIKFSDFYCKSSTDPFPWYCYRIDQTGGRWVGNDTNVIKRWDGSYMVLWGGSSGWLKFNNHFLRSIQSITFSWVYSGRNGGWHTIWVHERTTPSKSHALGNWEGKQVFTLPVDIPPDQEIWLYWEGGGDQGDGNNLDYLEITSVVFK